MRDQVRGYIYTYTSLAVTEKPPVVPLIRGHKNALLARGDKGGLEKGLELR